MIKKTGLQKLEGFKTTQGTMRFLRDFNTMLIGGITASLVGAAWWMLLVIMAFSITMMFIGSKAERVDAEAFCLDHPVLLARFALHEGLKGFKLPFADISYLKKLKEAAEADIYKKEPEATQ